jgi:penicillin-binding protein 1A
VSYIRQQLIEKYGENFINTQGAKVYTTLDYRLQQVAEDALRKQLDHIQTFFPPEEYVRPEGLNSYQAEKDSINKTTVQGALIAIDLRNGHILAMVGGREFSESNQFNRAVSAVRQAGSAFKPFLFTAALDNGWRCSDTVFDAQVAYSNPDGSYWEPSNFEEGYKGEMTLRDAFRLSQNIPAVKLQNDSNNRGIGARTVIKYARKMGITTPIPEVRSLAVGTAPVRLIDITTAFGVFPNFGIKIEPVAVREVWDKNNSRILYQPEGMRSEVLRPEVASLMTTMLKSVMVSGTGAGYMRSRPSGGKTGTGQDHKDAWFIGFTPYMACGVWIGFDSEETTLKYPARTGSTAALPVWAEFVETASQIKNFPRTDFEPKYITAQRLCADSHKIPTPFCPVDRIYTEYYLPDNGVTEICDIHGRSMESDEIVDPRLRSNEPRSLRGR